ncbi:hypothetical protein CUC15_04360 [Oceanobacillus zhaokaii]|uniref:Endonuclease NucS C-terminal domain-containing protein n=1 Tax=Oceanobacillus zhaokaii TaxID=2052660 RepID=A0A345PE13_9BACI|nr:hypothetical protein CUC15_04360 [Oceanobacillus zhaokaii]
MQILSEREIEDILVLHPELIESGLTLLERQGQLENRRTDLLFKDSNNQILLIELKKSVVLEEHVEQIDDYMRKINNLHKGQNRGMILGQLIPPSIQQLCDQRQIEWKEITIEDIYTYLHQHDNELLDKIFYAEKLTEKPNEVQTLSFHNYMNATSSPLGGPYTTYQFFMPKDASLELSEDKQENQKVADEIKESILSLEFNRKLFNGNVMVMRTPETEPSWSVKAKGAWQGYTIDYLLYISSNSQPIPCELYLGTIGYRGNPRAVYLDEKSRFIQLGIGKGKQKVTTQYGYHKYLKTKQRALFPFYELKFPRSIPKENWEKIYYKLNEYGYTVRKSEAKESQLLWIGEIALDHGEKTNQVANLIEALFATTIVKSHYMREGKGISFEFLSF